ncbi:hypothetical protein [Rheinheimera sp. NSM]|uniref:hypothetical protein n=1 Tax=Rheinheimera sp. NSM TaxID=3457884 RepID=UPI0040359BB1
MSRKVPFYVLFLLALSACSVNNYEQSAKDKAEKEKICQEMKEKMRELKGRPVRRTEVNRQYQLECMSDF